MIEIMSCLALTFFGIVSSDFMVDSGSDVNTLREEVLEDLDLELIGTVQSKGIHASRRRSMYRVIVVIGNIRVDTEVIYVKELKKVPVVFCNR